MAARGRSSWEYFGIPFQSILGSCKRVYAELGVEWGARPKKWKSAQEKKELRLGLGNRILSQTDKVHFVTPLKHLYSQFRRVYSDLLVPVVTYLGGECKLSYLL